MVQEGSMRKDESYAIMLILIIMLYNYHYSRLLSSYTFLLSSVFLSLLCRCPYHRLNRRRSFHREVAGDPGMGLANIELSKAPT
jgi:hypothetical protein